MTTATKAASEPVFTIRPILTPGIVLLVSLLVGVILLFPAVLGGMVIAGILGMIFGQGAAVEISALGAAGGLWLLGFCGYWWWCFYRMKRAHYDFYPEELVESYARTRNSYPLNQIGHVQFCDGRTFFLRTAYNTARKSSLIRIDVPRCDGARYFEQIRDVIRQADPDRLFSYVVTDMTLTRQEDIQYSVDLATRLNLNQHTVRRLVAGRRRQVATVQQPAIHDVTADDAEEPSFAVVVPLTLDQFAGRHAHMSPAELLLTDQNAESGELLLAAIRDVPHVLCTSEGVVVGHVQVQQHLLHQTIAVTFVGNRFTIEHVVTQHECGLSLNGAPAGKLRKGTAHGSSFVELAFDQPTRMLLALALLLGFLRACA
jgi:hypothetical protein